MSLDVVDLRAFYNSPLGEVARRLVSRVLRARWESQTTGLRVLGIGYATPYLDDFKAQAERALAFMPAAQGVIHWPLNGRSSSALVDATMMPLPDAAMDRILIIHALETGEHPRDLLEEVWRILAPGGRSHHHRAEPHGPMGPAGHHALWPRPSLFEGPIARFVAGIFVLADILGRSSLCAAVRAPVVVALGARLRTHRRALLSSRRRRSCRRGDQAALPPDQPAPSRPPTLAGA